MEVHDLILRQGREPEAIDLPGSENMKLGAPNVEILIQTVMLLISIFALLTGAITDD